MDKTIVFDNGSESNGMMGLIASLCQQRGLDPNMVAAMMNNRNNGDGFGGGYGWFWIIILLIFGWGGFGGNGFGGNRGGQGLADLGSLVNNDAGRELLMSAIQGNGNAISQLASTLHCDQNALNAQISNLQTQLCNIGNSVGMSTQQIVNAINSGNCQLGNQLATCCCNIQDSITRGNYENQISNLNQTNTLQNAINFVNSSVERGFSSTAYETAQQTCDLKNAIAAQTQVITDKFTALEMREMQNKIDSLREQNQTLQFAASQQSQNAYLLSQLQPVPKPAYLTCSPYQAQMHPFAYYGYNGNGCGCNCNSGCNNGCCNC